LRSNTARAFPQRDTVAARCRNACVTRSQIKRPTQAFAATKAGPNMVAVFLGKSNQNPRYKQQLQADENAPLPAFWAGMNQCLNSAQAGDDFPAIAGGGSPGSFERKRPRLPLAAITVMQRFHAKIVPMKTIELLGEVDDAESRWASGVAREWAEDLADPRQDIYTLADGEPVDEAR
jgi:hypothetical protein